MILSYSLPRTGARTPAESSNSVSGVVLMRKVAGIGSEVFRKQSYPVVSAIRRTKVRDRRCARIGNNDAVSEIRGALIAVRFYRPFLRSANFLAESERPAMDSAVTTTRPVSSDSEHGSHLAWFTLIEITFVPWIVRNQRRLFDEQLAHAIMIPPVVSKVDRGSRAPAFVSQSERMANKQAIDRVKRISSIVRRWLSTRVWK